MNKGEGDLSETTEELPGVGLFMTSCQNSLWMDQEEKGLACGIRQSHFRKSICNYVDVNSLSRGRDHPEASINKDGV